MRRHPPFTTISPASRPDLFFCRSCSNRTVCTTRTLQWRQSCKLSQLDSTSDQTPCLRLVSWLGYPSPLVTNIPDQTPLSISSCPRRPSTMGSSRGSEDPVVAHQEWVIQIGPAERHGDDKVRSSPESIAETFPAASRTSSNGPVLGSRSMSPHPNAGNGFVPRDHLSRAILTVV